MSKYNVGDKFTIEIKELINGSNDKMFYKSDCYSIIFGEEQLDKLQKYNGSTISEDTLEMVRMKALNEGRNEVWGLAKKLWHNDARTNDDIYGVEYFIDIANKYTPQEALTKLEAYEKEQAEIKEGDVVKIESTKERYIILAIYGKTIWGYSCQGVESPLQELDGVTITKTGKHIDIQSVLSQIAK